MAQQEVDSRKSPAQRATDLRGDRTAYIDAIASGVQRIQILQAQQDEISAELEKIDVENRQALEHLTALDAQIAALEA